MLLLYRTVEPRDILTEPNISSTESESAGDIPAPPSLVRGVGEPFRTARGPFSRAAAPPALTANPPAPTANPPPLTTGPLAVIPGPPALTPGVARPPPLQRAPAQSLQTDDGVRRIIVVRNTGSSTPTSPPADVPVSGGGGGKPTRPRRSSGHGCKVRITGQPAVTGVGRMPPAPTSVAGAVSVRNPSAKVVIVSPTIATTAPASAPASTPARTAVLSTSRSSSAAVAQVVVKSAAVSTPPTLSVPSGEPRTVGLSTAKRQPVATVRPLSLSGDSGGVESDGTRRTLSKDGGTQGQEQESGSRNVARRSSGSTSVSPLTSQLLQAAGARPFKVVTVKCTKGVDGVIKVERVPAESPVSPPAEVAAAGSTNGLPGTTRRRAFVACGATEKDGDVRPASPVKVTVKQDPDVTPASPAKATVVQDQSDKPASPAKVTVKQDPEFTPASPGKAIRAEEEDLDVKPDSPARARRSAPFSSSAFGGRRLTRAVKRAASNSPEKAQPVAKKRSWRATDE